MSEWQSDSIGALAAALAKAKLGFKPIGKKTDNPAYLRGGKAMKYADLSTIIEATEKALAANGLSIIQSPDVNVADHSMSLIGMLVHSSGEWMRFVTTLPAVQRERFDAQSCGSAITYARRYQYKSLIGAAEEDDDANLASGIGSKEAAKAVGDKKIAELKSKKTSTIPPTCLFYVLPENHNGHQAELINVKEYGETLNEVAAEGLRLILKKYVHLGKKNGELLVPNDKMQALADELQACQVDLRQLPAARANAGS